mgnify:CR=1 FL=1
MLICGRVHLFAKLDLFITRDLDALKAEVLTRAQTEDFDCYHALIKWRQLNPLIQLLHLTINSTQNHSNKELKIFLANMDPFIETDSLGPNIQRRTLTEADFILKV